MIVELDRARTRRAWTDALRCVLLSAFRAADLIGYSAILENVTCEPRLEDCRRARGRDVVRIHSLPLMRNFFIPNSHTSY